MTYELRLLVVALAVFALGVSLATLLVPLALARAARASAPFRSDALLRARMLPCAAGLLVTALTLFAYVMFERRGTEAVGRVLTGLAVFGVVLFSVAAFRLVRTLHATRRAFREWMRTADPVMLPVMTVPAFAVDASFPVVAVVGIARPRLVIARSVLAACAPDELEAILAHEQHHVDRHDNLKRAAMTALPDPLSWFPASRRLLAAWGDAGEEAADEAASRLGERGRTALAQALIRVARLAAPGATPGLLPASALYSGGSLERRVKRLLTTETPAPRRANRWIRALAASGTVAAVAALDLWHHVIEFAVTELP